MGVGNQVIASPNLALQGDIAFTAAFNRVLTLREMQDWQADPRRESGAYLFFELGASGVGTQPDLTGHSNDGTVVGATLSLDNPLDRRSKTMTIAG